MAPILFSYDAKFILNMYNANLFQKVLNFLHLYTPLQNIGADKAPDIRIKGMVIKYTNV